MQTNANAPRPAADFTLPAAGDILLYISLYNMFSIPLINVVCHQKTHGSFASGTSGGGAGSRRQWYE
jgi:hypothetical protein